MIKADTDFNLNIHTFSKVTKKKVFAVFILFLTITIIYSNSFNCGWHFDDFSNIVNNPNISINSFSKDQIIKTFYGTNNTGTRLSRPLSFFTFAINKYFHGNKVFGYHIVNFTIHIITAVFLYLLIYKTLCMPKLKNRYKKNAHSIAFLSSFIWATHPINVTAITYIVQRMASMAAMFFIISLYFYVKGHTVNNRQKFVFFFLSAICGMLSFASKENAVMLPFIIWLYDLYFIQSIKKNIKKNLIFASSAILIIIILAFININFNSILQGYENRPFTIIQRVFTQPRVIIFYIFQLLYPVSDNFALIHDIEISTSLFNPFTTSLSILFIISSVSACIYFSKKQPVISFCIIFFFLNHLVEGSILPLELIYEHRNYLPATLFFVPSVIFIIYILDYFAYKPQIQYFIAGAIALLLSCQGHTTYYRNTLFKNELTLWHDNVAKAPNLSRTHNNLGKVYFNCMMYEQAFHEFITAEKLNKDVNYSQLKVIQYNLGLYHFYVKKEYIRALFYFKKALYYPKAIAAIAMIKLKQGKTDEAYNLVYNALCVSPPAYMAILTKNLSIICFKQGKIDQCIKYAKEVLKLRPNSIEIYKILGSAYKKNIKYKEATNSWEKFLNKNPDSFPANLALAEIYFLTNKQQKLKKTVNSIIFLSGKESVKSKIDKIIQKKELSTYIPDYTLLSFIIKKELNDKIKAL